LGNLFFAADARETKKSVSGSRESPALRLYPDRLPSIKVRSTSKIRFRQTICTVAVSTKDTGTRWSLAH